MALPTWRGRSPEPNASVKILVAGAFGVGKSTAIDAVSEIQVLTTEAVMTEASSAHDDLSAVPGKSTTTVMMDYGRLTLGQDLQLYLFGTPGQARFWFLWDDLSRGAIGAIVLVDTRRLADAFAALNYFEERGDIPYLVAVNTFDGLLSHPLDEVRDALALAPYIPLLAIDARENDHVLSALTDLIDHAMSVLHA
jgi:signal recognition particle receptor subunit beta